MPETSKTIANLGLIMRTLVSALRNNKDALSGTLGELLFPDGVPEALTLAQVIEALAALLERDHAALAASEHALTRERGEVTAARAARDEATEALYAYVVRVRGVLALALSATAMRRLDLSGETPYQPDQLLAFSRDLIEQLRALPEDATDAGAELSLDRGVLLTRLEQLCDALTASLAEVDDEQRESQTQQVARDAARARWSQHYGPVARTTEALFTLVGMHEHARRARYTRRRDSGAPEPEDLDGAPIKLLGSASEPAVETVETPAS